MLTFYDMNIRREVFGLSYERIAKESGVPLGTVQKVFSGITKNPRNSTLERLSSMFEKYEIPKNPNLPVRHEDDFCTGRVSDEIVPYITGTTAEKNAENGRHTIKDYLALPDDRRVELIDGVFYDMAAPYPAHQEICLALAASLRGYIDSKGGPCRVFVSPIDVQLDRDDRTVVQPDVLVICNPEIIQGPRVYGAPDLVIEVLSKATKKKDLTVKVAKYSEAGVREYWAVDPVKLKIIVFDFEHDDEISIYGFHDKVPVGIYDGDLKIDFEKILNSIRGMYGVGEEKVENGI